MNLLIDVIREICTHNLITSFVKITILYFHEAILTQLYLHAKHILWRQMLQF